MSGAEQPGRRRRSIKIGRKGGDANRTNDVTPDDLPGHDEPSFRAKAKAALVSIGLEGLEKVFLAAHVMRDPDTPWKAKSLLAGSLAYFILPFDKVPDWILVLGYTDDLAMLTTALLSVAASVKPEHHDMAKQSVAKVRRETTTSE